MPAPCTAAGQAASRNLQRWAGCEATVLQGQGTEGQHLPVERSPPAPSSSSDADASERQSELSELSDPESQPGSPARTSHTLTAQPSEAASAAPSGAPSCQQRCLACPEGSSCPFCLQIFHCCSK